MVGAGTPSPTSIYRCYRSCLPSLPGDEGEVVQTRVIWCASSLLVTRGGGRGWSRLLLASVLRAFDCPGRKAPSSPKITTSLMRKLVQVPPENPLDLFTRNPFTIHPQGRDKCNPSSRAQQEKARQHAIPWPWSHVVPLPSPIDGRSPTPPSPKPLRKEGWAGARGVGLGLWSRRGGEHHNTGGRDGMWRASRVEETKKERRRERIPSPSRRPNPSGEKLSPVQD